MAPKAYTSNGKAPGEVRNAKASGQPRELFQNLKGPVPDSSLTLVLRVKFSKFESVVEGVCSMGLFHSLSFLFRLAHVLGQFGFLCSAGAAMGLIY